MLDRTISIANLSLFPILLYIQFMKSLKIPKGQSESVYRRRTDNTIAQNKKYKRTSNDPQNIYIKLKIE